MQRYTVHYSGNVQGVGFRYTSARIATRHRVAGYIQNLPDGRVKLVAEGEKEALQTLMGDIQEAMSRNITQTDIDRAASTGEFGDPCDPDTFSVRY